MNAKLGLTATLFAVSLAGCGRDGIPLDLCERVTCACVFDEDCPDEFTCIDNRCIRIEDIAECLARGPRDETCNGRDDDCDGTIDDGLGARTCTAEANGLTCTGPETCLGEAGWVCEAPLPSPEVCDGLDNDCDGVEDGPFLTNGVYLSVENCGACGADCRALVPGSTAVGCELTEGGPGCRVDACGPGLIPNPERTACVAIGDGLCEPCVEDSDCPGVGSACVDLDDGERACGRACAPGDCPTGFECRAGQCVPGSGTCQCDARTAGTIRACTIDVCGGLQRCEADPGGRFDWGPCDISANVEACDGADNDCDGEIDEDFIDPRSGRYTSDRHCGVCNNDCTRQFSEDDHAVGGCDADPAVPECVIRACDTEVVQGVTFEWVDVDGETDNGCECRRRQGNLADDPDVTSDFPDVGTQFVDENCDGIDGVLTDAVFVSASAAPGGNGSRQSPFRRIENGLTALRRATDRVYVLVAEGQYAERVVLQSGDRLYGGYSGDFFRRDVVQLPSVIRAPVLGSDANQASVIVRGAGFSEIAGFEIRGPDLGVASAGADGRSSVGVWLDRGAARASVRNNAIIGGRGEDGGRGTAGLAGFGRDDSLLLDGDDGANHQNVRGPCPAGFRRAGGNGGRNPSCNLSGRGGGDVLCPFFDWNATPVRGDQAEFIGSALDGEGGFDWSYDDISGPGCGHATESGFPSDIDQHSGRDGRDGSDGTDGTNAGGCADAFGLPPIGLAFRPGSGASGASGTSGSSGGGGGAGGGTARFLAGGCPAHETGATGGGGGAPGCGGEAGRGGGGGGASIAVLLSEAGTTLRVTDNRITRGAGGNGGAGGLGGAGGRGGIGGFGGSPTTFSGSSGGRGGDGGRGGTGGAGGGGCGGPSFGLLQIGDPLPAAGNEFVNSSANLGGPGGEGGVFDAAFDDGAPGPSEDRFGYLSCPNGSCPSGQICSGGFCFPL